MPQQLTEDQKAAIAEVRASTLTPEQQAIIDSVTKPPEPVVPLEPVVPVNKEEETTRNLTEAGLSADYLDSTVRKNAEARESGVPRYDFGPDFNPTKPDIKDVGLDFAKLWTDTRVDLEKLGIFAATKIAKAVPNRQIQESLDVIESPEMQNVINRTLSENAAETTAKVTGVDVMTIYDSDTGRIFPMDTAIGTAAEVGTYLAGGIGIYKNIPELLMKSKTWRNGFLKSTASGGAIDQLLTNPDENISNVIENVMGEETAREWNSYLFLAADKDDSEAIKRLKLLGEGSLMGALIDVVGGVNTFRKLIRDKFSKTPRQLSPEDKGELFVDFIEEQKKKITTPKEGGSVDQWKEDYVTPSSAELQDAAAIRNLREEPELRFDETPKGQAQIELQQSSVLNRVLNSTFTSRGFWTPKAFDAFNDSLYAQRTTIHEAEIISSKLNKVINNFNDNDPRLNDRVMTAFNTPLDDSASPYLTPIENVARQFDLPDEVAEQVLEGRAFIDQLSERLSDSTMVSPELKDIIQDNIGSYIRRSFRLFEDKNYKPSDEIKNDAIDFIAQKYMNAGELPDTSKLKAGLDVNNILNRGDKSALEYMASIQKLNNKIFKAKNEDIPVEIRKLMGEIESVDESVIVTAQKMAKFYNDAEFHENLLRLGDGKYIFKVRNLGQSNTLPGTEAVSPVEPRATIRTETDDVIFDTDVYSTEITGTGSMLDGVKDEFTYYTTPEIASALKSDQGSFDLRSMNSFYKGFLSLKGLSQKSKTVYSVPTQVRNVIGGAQFGPANGIIVNPASQSVKDTFKTLYNNATDKGDEGLNELYQKYLRLGVVNTNTNVSEFRSLLESGFRDADKNILDSATETLANYGGVRGAVGETLDPLVKRGTKAVDPVLKGMEKSYVAVDDFYKIVIHNAELDTLKKALPDADVSLLEAEAARIVRSTVPNYDFVPPYVKRLRQMPFGSFVSFPAESLRTSVNIYREAFREISSSNKVLQRRGMRRFAGRTTQMGVWYGAAEGMGALVGLGREKLKALQTIDEKPWSKSSPRIPVVLDGETYLIDTQFLNSYETINAPFAAMFEEVRTGKLKGEALETRIVNGTLTAIGDLLGPYTDQPILTQALTDVGYAALSSDGRTARGNNLFNDVLSTQEKLENGIWHIFQSFIPTTGFSAEDIARSGAFLATPDRNTGYVTPTGVELAATFAGLRLNKVDPETVLGYRVSEYNGRKNDLARPIINYENTPEKIVDEYVALERKRYESMQDIYRQILATKELIGLSKTLVVLKNRNMGNLEIGSLLAGKYFTPYNIVTETSLMSMFEKTPFDPESEINSVSKLVKALTDKRIEMLNTNLFFEEEEESPPPTSPEISAAQQTEEQEFKDFKLAKGGEVYDVPQVPEEPDERIDKMTGLPYNMQAGGAFVDEEDRERSAAGGKVLGSLQRTRKAEGGIFDLLKEGLKGGAALVGNAVEKKLDEKLQEGAALLGFDGDKQVQITADSVDLTNQISPLSQQVGVKRFVPGEYIQGPPVTNDEPLRRIKSIKVTTDQLRNAGINRDQFKIDGDEEVFDTVNHALFGYESGAGPMTAFAGQAKEMYQGAKQAIKGQEWRTELKDMWNNSWGINQRKLNLSRPEFDMALAQAIMNSKNKLERGEVLQMGQDVIINRMDIAQK